MCDMPEFLQDTMYDLIVFYHKRDCVPWAEYIQGMLTKREDPFKVYLQEITDVFPEMHQRTLAITQNAKCHMVLCSISMEDFILENPTFSLSSIPNPNNAVCLCLGCEASQQASNDAYEKCFPGFSQWHLFHVTESDDTQVTKLILKTASIIDGYEQSFESEDYYMPMTGDNDAEPKRPRSGRQSITRQDEIDQLDSTYYVPPKESTLKTEKKAKEQKSFSITPRKITTEPTTVVVVFNDEMTGKFDINLETSSTRLKPKHRKLNNYCITVQIPGNLAGEVTMAIFHNDNFVGTESIMVVSKFQQLEKILADCLTPLELMKQALKLDDQGTDALDIKLTEMFEKYMPNDGMNHVFNFSPIDSTSTTSEKELPTLFHFAARYGLCELCNKIMDCPGAHHAYQIMNYHGQFPCMIAKEQGYTDLSESIKDSMALAAGMDDLYMQMASNPETYDNYMRHSAYDVPRPANHYDTPRPLSLYDIPHGSDYRTTPQGNSQYDVPRGTPISTPYSNHYDRPRVATLHEEYEEHDGYVHMGGKIPNQGMQRKTTQSERRPFKEAASLEDNRQSKTLPRLPKATDPFFNCPDTVQTKSATPKSQSLDEIVNIMEEYKEGELNESDVITLFKDWQRRETPKSFKDRQKNIKEMKQKVVSKPGGIFKFFRSKPKKNVDTGLSSLTHASMDMVTCLTSKNTTDTSPRTSTASNTSTSSRGSKNDSAIFSDIDDGQGGDIYTEVQEETSVSSRRINVPPNPSKVKSNRKSVRYTNLEKELKKKGLENKPSLPPRPGKPAGPTVPPRNPDTQLTSKSSFKRDSPPPRPSKASISSSLGSQDSMGTQSPQLSPRSPRKKQFSQEKVAGKSRKMSLETDKRDNIRRPSLPSNKPLLGKDGIDDDIPSEPAPPPPLKR